MKRIRRVFLLVIGPLVLLCVVAGIISALSNRNLLAEPASLSNLNPLDKARLAETLHLKQELGERVWPGWGQMDIPVILWNRDYSFLIGYPSLPSRWDMGMGDTFEGQVYYRKRSNDPQNFAVKVDDCWAASMATKWETDAFLMNSFREFLPPLIDAVFPYRIFIQPSEVQITGVLHESFHVYQTQVTLNRLEEAEDAHRYGEMYWQADEAMHDDWTEEIDLLTKALEAESKQEVKELANSFLNQQEQRRMNHGLDEALITYERQLEWEEGLDK